MNLFFADSKMVAGALGFAQLIDNLQAAFAENNIQAPLRHHHDYANPPEEVESALLLMPAWQAGQELGVKVITASPANAKYELPAIQGLYLLFDARTGQPQMVMDATELTVKRTAAASALASRYLSRADSSTLLMVGTGALAPNLIRAHATVRPDRKVLVWMR